MEKERQKIYKDNVPLIHKRSLRGKKIEVMEEKRCLNMFFRTGRRHGVFRFQNTACWEENLRSHIESYYNKIAEY